MAERDNRLLAFGILAAIGAYLVIQSEKGKGIVQAAVDAGGSLIDTVAKAIGPRGIRNNNPGNIVRSGVSWVGMSPDQSSDPRFIVFSAPEYGIRAMARVLRNYIGNGYNTVQEIINRWAPPIENDTGAYVRAVAQHLGLEPNAPVDTTHIPAMIEAIIKHENGQQPYSWETIAEGVRLERTA